MPILKCGLVDSDWIACNQLFGTRLPMARLKCRVTAVASMANRISLEPSSRTILNTFCPPERRRVQIRSRSSKGALDANAGRDEDLAALHLDRSTRCFYPRRPSGAIPGRVGRAPY